MVFKFKGLSVFGEYFDSTTERNIASDFDNDGYNLQVGYFLVPQKFEVALRQAMVDPNSDRDDDEREERGLALGYFFNKHNHKLQADYRQIENKATNVEDDELRLQYQIIF